MSEILKTEAVVLSKMNYGDTSSIVSLFTEDHGKISLIVKGARSPKSKYGKIVDPLNYLSIVFYKKESREIQLLSQADLIEHYQRVKSNIDSIEYALAVIELVKYILADAEVNKKIFKGTIRILSRLNTGEEEPEISFGRFFFFILKEIGYEIQLESCSICGKTNFNGKLFYNFDKGLICGECRKTVVEIYDVNLELLGYLICLKNNESAGNFSNLIKRKAINFMESHLKYHLPGFKGLSSIKLFNER
jgi:DNA repair protein RecO (recombination protein O)